MVFYIDGSSSIAKHNELFQRIKSRLRKYANIIDCVDNNIPVKEIMKRIPYIFSLQNQGINIIKLCRKYGEIVNTYHNECDTEIARYANKNNNVVAILADDTDFLIYPGAYLI